MFSANPRDQPPQIPLSVSPALGTLPLHEDRCGYIYSWRVARTILLLTIRLYKQSTTYHSCSYYCTERVSEGANDECERKNHHRGMSGKRYKLNTHDRACTHPNSLNSTFIPRLHTNESAQRVCLCPSAVMCVKRGSRWYGFLVCVIVIVLSLEDLHAAP